MTTAKACFTCMRGERYFAGCSHIDCPVRHQVTAQPVGERFRTPARGIESGSADSDGFRRDPNIGEQE